MKAFILAGGKGTRFLEENKCSSKTNDRNKWQTNNSAYNRSLCLLRNKRIYYFGRIQN